MFTISKQYTFSAAHHIDTLPDDHPCKRVHGHNYTAEFVVMCNDLDEHGFVIDFRAMDAIIKPIIDEIDHRDLNHIVAPNMPTTSEYLAGWLFHVVDLQIGGGSGTIYYYDGETATHDDVLALALTPAQYNTSIKRMIERERKSTPRLMKVRVSETGKTWAEYTR